MFPKRSTHDADHAHKASDIRSKECLQSLIHKESHVVRQNRLINEAREEEAEAENLKLSSTHGLPQCPGMQTHFSFVPEESSAVVCSISC